MITTLSLVMNIIGGRARGRGGGVYDHLMSTRTFTLIMDKIVM